MAVSSSELTDGIWPGYVAAMASLLLSLVLVLAVLAVTISQIGTITEGYNEAIRRSGFGSKEQVDRLAKVAGIGDGTGDGTGTGTGNAKASAGMPSAQKGAPSLITAKPDRFILDMGRANFDRDAARRAAEWVGRDKNLLRQIDLSKVDLSKLNYSKLDISKIDLSKNLTADELKKIDFSKVNLGHLTAKRIEALKPFIAKEGIRYQMLLQGTQKPITANNDKPPPPKEAPPKEPPPPPKEPPPKPEKLFIRFIEETTEPLPQQRQQIIQALSQMARDAKAVRIWTRLPSNDLYTRRTAFSRLTAMQVLAVEAGFGNTAIQLDMEAVPGKPVPQREMTVYVEAKQP